MAQMIRKQVYIGKRHQLVLKRLATAWGVSEAEVIRQAFDSLSAPTGFGQSVALSAHLPADPQAWEEIRRSIGTLRASDAPFDSPRQWNRDELYEDRVSRYARDSR